jgi:hypothetical protein
MYVQYTDDVNEYSSMNTIHKPLSDLFELIFKERESFGRRVKIMIVSTGGASREQLDLLLPLRKV